MADERISRVALQDLRVLDLADPKGLYCTKLLADLGADVIKVERPGGDAARLVGPFFHEERDPFKSLYWFHLNTNKRGITLNLDTADGRDLLKRLVRKADVMVETFPPGHLDNMGLGYSVLKEISPSLILTSITPFGQTGPWRDYASCDMVASALGGLMNVCGWPDRQPVRMAGSQAYHLASLQAAAATLVATYHRIMTGEGQHVDVSMHESVPICLMVSVPIYTKTGQILKRTGDQHDAAATGIFACKDGYVDFRLRYQRWGDFVNWLDSEGMAADLKEERWQDPFFRNEESSVKHIDEVFHTFLMKHTKKEIYEEGQRWGFEVGAVNTPQEVAKDPQLLAREYFVSVEHPELNSTLKYLGAPFRLSETPWRIASRAPLVGEHNGEVYEKELGFSSEEIARLKEAGII